MNTNIFQTIRVAGVLVIALFAFINNAFAAPSVAPATAKNITENSAMLVGHVSNPHKSTVVWFEFAEGSGSFVAVGTQPPLYDNGTSITFDYLLRDLKEAQTYSYRAVAMEGGVTTYSPTSTFTTVSPKAVTPIVITPSITIDTKTTETKTQDVIVKKENATTTPAVSSEGFVNGNSAAIIGVGGEMFPTTFVGWMVLLIAILVLVLLSHMVYQSIEKRKEAIRKKQEGKEEKDEELE